MATTRSRNRLPVVSDAYPWADIVIDLSHNRVVALPETLEFTPPLHQFSRVHKGNRYSMSAHLCSRKSGGTDVVLVVETLPGHTTTPTRIAFAYYQTQQSVLVQSAMLTVLHTAAPPWHSGSPPRSDNNTNRQMRAMGALAQGFADAHAEGKTDGWTVKQARSFVVLMLAGFNDPTDLSTFAEAGIDLAENREILRRLRGGRGLDAAQIAYWWDTCSESNPNLLAALAESGMTHEDLAPFRGTHLDPLDADTNVHLSSSLRVQLVVDVLRSGWTARGRVLADRSAPEGCEPEAWARIWEDLMPAAKASAYLCAGYSFAEAVTHHKTGTGPDDDALAMMGALSV